MSFLESIYKFFRSRKLAVILFLTVALISIYGTFITPDKAERYYVESFGERFLPLAGFLGLTDSYRSPVFLTVMLLLCLNLAFCTWHRFSLRRSSRDRPGGGKARLVRWMDLLLHASVLVILAGGMAKGIWGFVGTKNIHVGLSENTVFDWRLERDVTLPFTIRVKDRVDEYYPVGVKVGVTRASTGEKLGLLELGADQREQLPGRGGWLALVRFERDSLLFSFEAVIDGREVSFDLAGEESRNTAGVGALTFTLVAWKQELKKIRSLLNILEGGEVVKEGWVSPNTRVKYRETSFFLTAWGVDDYGSRFVGLQVTRDPGALVFWTGCLLFSVVLPLHLIVRHGR